MTVSSNRVFAWSFLLAFGISSTCNAVPEPNGRRVPLVLQRNVESKVSKIVGGYPASEGEVPWQVALYGQFFCGGTLLSSDVVLTAAHCVMSGGQLDTDFKVGYGGLSLLNFPFETAVKQVITHEAYNENTFQNDIALVIFENPVQNFTNLVYPANLPVSHNEDYEGEEVTASGWERLSFEGPQPEQLQAVQLKVSPQESCKNAYMAIVDIGNTMICAGVEEFSKDSCQGDSGGPLVKVIGNYSELIGITSFGVEGCAVQGYPSVYTRVTEYLEWIVDTACAAGSCLEYEYVTDDPCEDGDCTTNGATLNVNHSQLIILQSCIYLFFILVQ
ncbi:unnamed protein product, partial [Meganyctiphanes norvegica]